MNAKKIVGFLLCRPAFTQRNMTSLLLVGLFVGAYILAGGKISTKLPSMQSMSHLNSLEEMGDGKAAEGPENVSKSQAQMPSEEQSKTILGIKPTEDLAAREKALNSRGSLFTADERAVDEQKPLDKDGLIQGISKFNRREEIRLEKAEKKSTDSLSAIEDRLRIKRR